MGSSKHQLLPGSTGHVWYPGQEGGLTGWQAAGGGLGLGYIEVKHNQAKTAQRQAREARTAEEKRQAQIQSNVDELNAKFGIGDSAEAVSNKGKLGAFYQNYQDTNEAASDASIDKSYAGTQQGNRQRLADQGLGGSSVDYDAQRANLTQYITSRQQALASAQQASKDLFNQNDQYRQGLQTQIQAGTSMNPDWQSINSNLGYNLSSARENVAPAAIGGAFQAAGSAYGDAAINAGATGTGSSFLRGAFSPSGGSSRSAGSFS